MDRDAEAVALRAETDLGAVRHNARVLRAAARGREAMAVVKADAYGHGAVPVARVLQDEGIRRFAVATVPEAVALRRAGIEGPVLVLGAPLPGYLAAYVRHALTVAVVSRASADAVAEAARTTGPLTVHVKVETGMNRLGVAPADAPALVRRLQAAPGVTVEALWTHLATADGGTDADAAFAREQAAAFASVVAALGDDRPPRVHVENSPALVQDAWPDGIGVESETAPLVRLGGALYGLPSSRALVPAFERLGLRAALRVTTRVVHVHRVRPGETVSYGRTWTAPRETCIGTLAVGYADGLPRALSSTAAGPVAAVAVRGERVPIVGRVCMDLTMVDLGPDTSVAVGDEAVLAGPGGPSALEQAEAAGTIAYTIATGLTARVVRTWRDAPPDATATDAAPPDATATARPRR